MLSCTLADCGGDVRPFLTGDERPFLGCWLLLTEPLEPWRLKLRGRAGAGLPLSSPLACPCPWHCSAWASSGCKGASCSAATAGGALSSSTVRR